MVPALPCLLTSLLPPPLPPAAGRQRVHRFPPTKMGVHGLGEAPKGGVHALLGDPLGAATPALMPPPPPPPPSRLLTHALQPTSRCVGPTSHPHAPCIILPARRPHHHALQWTGQPPPPPPPPRPPRRSARPSPCSATGWRGPPSHPPGWRVPPSWTCPASLSPTTRVRAVPRQHTARDAAGLLVGWVVRACNSAGSAQMCAGRASRAAVGSGCLVRAAAGQ